MSAGQYETRLRRGIKRRQEAQLYVKRRTTKRGNARLLVPLPASVRYALCTWGSYRPSLRARALSQELLEVIWEGLRGRLGEDAEMILDEVYQNYAKECAEAGKPNVFEVAE
jgi:hypothetical protein